MNRDVEVHGLHPLSAGNDVHIVRRIYQSNVGIIEKILELWSRGLVGLVVLERFMMFLHVKLRKHHRNLKEGEGEERNRYSEKAL